MTVTLDDHIVSAHRHAAAVLKVIEAGHGEEAAAAYAGGLIAGVCGYLVARRGSKATYDLMQGMTDDIVSTGLAKIMESPPQ